MQELLGLLGAVVAVEVEEVLKVVIFVRAVKAVGEGEQAVQPGPELEPLVLLGSPPELPVLYRQAWSQDLQV